MEGLAINNILQCTLPPHSVYQLDSPFRFFEGLVLRQGGVWAQDY